MFCAQKMQNDAGHTRLSKAQQLCGRQKTSVHACACFITIRKAKREMKV
jgi:hypothetical protein